MRDEPDHEHGIYRVLHTLIVGASRLTAESDLIFLDEVPFVVLEWGGPQESQYPDLKLQLDPAALQPTPGRAGYFLYSGDLVDPRKVQ
jgi:hypothetical protein